MKKLITAAAVLLSLYACNNKPAEKTYFSDAFSYNKTVKELNEVVKFVGFAPIVASRNYAYANIAAYECIAAGYPKEYNSLNGQINGFTIDVSSFGFKDQQIDYEFASLLAFCKVGEAVTFPEGSMKDYVDSLKNFAEQSGMPARMFANSVAFADSVSKKVLAWSKKFKLKSLFFSNSLNNFLKENDLFELFDFLLVSFCRSKTTVVKLSFELSNCCFEVLGVQSISSESL